jgi:phage gp36-like protein
MYATVTDLKRYLQDTHDELYFVEADADVTPDELASDDLQAASAEIDGALGCRYVVPVIASAVLPLLRTWCLALTSELSWGRSGGGEPPEALKTRLKLIRELLAEYAAGRRTMPAEPLQGAGNGPAMSGYVACDTPRMTRERLKGW